MLQLLNTSAEPVHGRSLSLESQFKFGDQCADHFLFVQTKQTDTGNFFYQWDLQANQPEELPVKFDVEHVQTMNCTADGSQVFAWLVDTHGVQQFVLWDRATDQTRTHKFNTKQDIKAPVISFDGSYIAALKSDGNYLYVWTTTNLAAAPQEIQPQSVEGGPFRGFDWMHNTNRLLTYSKYFIHVWNIDYLMQQAKGNAASTMPPLILSLENETSPIEFAAFNVDGTQVISFDGNGRPRIKIWRVWPDWPDLAEFVDNYRKIIQIGGENP